MTVTDRLWRKCLLEFGATPVSNVTVNIVIDAV